MHAYTGHERACRHDELLRGRVRVRGDRRRDGYRGRRLGVHGQAGVRHAGVHRARGDPPPGLRQARRLVRLLFLCLCLCLCLLLSPFLLSRLLLLPLCCLLPLLVFAAAHCCCSNLYIVQHTPFPAYNTTRAFKRVRLAATIVRRSSVPRASTTSALQNNRSPRKQSLQEHNRRSARSLRV